MELWGLEAKVGEGVPQRLLGVHHLGQLGGEGLGQLDHLLVASLVVAEYLDLALQLQVHRFGSPAHLLRQDLPGALCLGGGGVVRT